MPSLRGWRTKDKEIQGMAKEEGRYGLQRMWKKGSIHMSFPLQQKKVYRVAAVPFEKQQTKKFGGRKNER